MYKINAPNISGIGNLGHNSDWRVVMTNYVCMHVRQRRSQRIIKLSKIQIKHFFEMIWMLLRLPWRGIVPNSTILFSNILIHTKMCLISGDNFSMNIMMMLIFEEKWANPHQTVTCPGCVGFSMYAWGFSVPKCDNFDCLHTRQYQNGLHLKRWFLWRHRHLL